MITVKAAENTPQEIKRSRDRVRYANMSDEAKKEKISRRIWTVPLSEGMSLCLLEKDYSSKVFFFQPTSYGLFVLSTCFANLLCLPQRMEMLQFSKKLPKSPVLHSPEVRQMVINSKPLITKHWTAT